MASKTSRDSGRQRRSNGKSRRASRRGEEADSSPGQFADHARRQARQVAGSARERVLDRLEFQRGALSSALEEAAGGLKSAGRRTDSPLARELLRAGDRALRDVSMRLEEHSVEDVLEAAGRTFERRPGLTVVGLLGVGVLAGRVFRASTDAKGRD